MNPIRVSILAALLSIAATQAASAHAHLLSAEPGDGAAVTVGPNDLKLTFSEALEAKLSGAAVAAEGKGEISTDTPVLAEGNDRVLIIPLQERLGAGKYTVNWHALSKDGHTTHSSYSFVVRP